MALLALLSLTWQSLIVQTHVHAAPAAAAVQGTAVIGLASARHAPDPEPATCPACRQLAQNGHYLTPTAPMPVPAAATSAMPAATVRHRSAGRVRSHDWRSRGPPAEDLHR